MSGKYIGYCKIAVSIIYTLLVGNVSGQNTPDSLSVYLELAAKNNPTVMQNYYEYQAALQKVTQVGSLPDPELNIGYFLKPMELMNGLQIADIKLMQMFPWKGTLKESKDEMTLMAKAKYESFLDAKSTVFYNIQSTWFELYGYEKEIQITTKNISILQMIERLAIVKYKSSGSGISTGSVSGNSEEMNTASSSAGNSSGMQSMSGGVTSTSTTASQSMQSSAMGSATSGLGLADLFKIKIAIMDLQNDSALLQSQKITLMAKFNSYLNRPEQTAVYLPDSLQLTVLRMPIEAVLDSIKANSPMLGMLNYEMKSLESRKKMVTKMGYPMIGIGLNYTIIGKSEMSTSDMNGKDMIMPMVSVTLPIYRKKYNAMITESELLNKAKEQEYVATENTLQTEYYKAVQLYLDASRRMKLYASQYQLSSKSLELFISSFTSSGSELNDVLVAQQQMLDYQYKQEEARVDYNTAIAFLNQLMAIFKTQ